MIYEASSVPDVCFFYPTKLVLLAVVFPNTDDETLWCVEPPPVPVPWVGGNRSPWSPPLAGAASGLS